MTRVVLEVDDVAEYSAFLLPNPYRLIIDIHGKAQNKALLAKKSSPEELIAAAEGGEALPGAVRNRLKRDERLDAALAGLRRIAAEQRQVAGDPQLTQLLSRYRAQAATAAAKRIADRLSELVRVVDALDGENEIVNFETTKGEKEFLEESFDVGAQLGAQTLHRPRLSGKGEEYWQFDGEYWADEIGYYRYTLKDACPAQGKGDASDPFGDEDCRIDARRGGGSEARRNDRRPRSNPSQGRGRAAQG